MPSRLPRLALTIPEDLKVTLDDLGDAMGKPTSKVVVDLLEEMAPQLRNMAEMIRFAQQGNKAGAKRVLAHMIGDQMADFLASTQGDLLQDQPKKLK